MKDWQKELIIGVILLVIAGLFGYKTWIIAKEIGTKLGISAIKILAFPIVEGLAILFIFLGLIVVWIGIEDKRLEKELKELERELEEVEKELNEPEEKKEKGEEGKKSDESKE